MNFEGVKSWLEEWIKRRASAQRLQGVLGLVLVPLALATAMTIVYGLLRLFLHDPAGNLGDSSKCFWISAAVLPVLFIGNKIAPRRDLMEERMSAGPGDIAGAMAARRTVVPMVLLWILFTGPRLTDWAIACFRRAKMLGQIDAHSCAAVLWMIISAGRKVPCEDLTRDMDWLNLPATLADLKQVEGILFLAGPPPAVTLTSEARAALLSDLKNRS